MLGFQGGQGGGLGDSLQRVGNLKSSYGPVLAQPVLTPTDWSLDVDVPVY